MGHSILTRARNSLAVALRLTALALLVIGAVKFASRKAARPGLLHRRIASVDFRGVSLEQALNQLGQAVGAKVIIDRPALKAAGVNLAETMRIHLHDVELGTAFDHLSFHRTGPCVMEPHDNGLMVTSLKALPSVVRVYEIGDLLEVFRASTFWKIPTGGRGPAGHVLGPYMPPTEKEMTDALVNTITGIVRPAMWATNGGVEHLEVIGSRLIVTGRMPVQREVEALLFRLRAAETVVPAPKPSANAK